jgi:hypothetical protein
MTGLDALDVSQAQNIFGNSRSPRRNAGKCRLGTTSSSVCLLYLHCLPAYNMLRYSVLALLALVPSIYGSPPLSIGLETSWPAPPLLLEIM